jgi:lipoate-protein ligase A
VTPPLRVFDTGIGGARWNVAVTAALGELHAAGHIGDTLRLHRYRTCVLLGRSQPVDAALDRVACARRGAEIARRVTGGGAVAMAPGILAWDLVTGRGDWRALEDVSADLCRALAAALGRFGVAARFRPPGDVVVADRKLAGTSGAFDGRTVVQQGSLLVDADAAEMAELLGLPALPIVTLAELADRTPAMPEVAEAVTAALAGALGRRARPEAIGERERDRAAALLAEEIGTEDFVEDGAAR